MSMLTAQSELYLAGLNSFESSGRRYNKLGLIISTLTDGVKVLNKWNITSYYTILINK